MTQQKTRRYFDKFSSDYHGHMAKTNHFAVQTKILEQFKGQIRGKVLDIATGTGSVVKILQSLGAKNIHALDYSPGMLIQAKKSTSGVKFHFADAHNLPFRSRYFDIVACSYGFYWFKKPDSVIM